MTISDSIMKPRGTGRRPSPAASDPRRGPRSGRAASAPRRAPGDGAAPGHALIRRERRAVLHVLHEQLEGSLSVRLHEFELGERVSERFDVVAVLYFVQPIGRTPSIVIVVAIIMAAPGQRRRDAARIGPRVVIDWQ